ncbi:helix-turn-helix transcriptional regulator [Cohnella lubricantis]
MALLSGMSVDWYTWLEQARPIQVSAQVLESLSRALQLDANERKHLYLLALRQMPADTLHRESAVSDRLQKFLDQQGDQPAVVYDPRLNIVGWNKPACKVYGDYAQMTERERNSVWRIFMDPYFRVLLREGWEGKARLRLAQFRANYGQFTGDSWWTEFIAELSETSEEFAEWWQQHDVLDSPEGSKLLYHPVAGTLSFDHISFHPTDAPDLSITVHLPLEDTAARMRLLVG